MIKPEQIKEHRKALGLSQVAYAERYGVSPQQVRLQWEKRGITSKAIDKARELVRLSKEIER